MNKLKDRKWLDIIRRSVYSSAYQKPQKEPIPCEWSVAVKEAERVVGYPTSFLNLRWLLNDEVANVAMHLRKLVGTDHPLLKTARDFFLKTESPAWGLVVLLVARAGGLREEVAEIERDRTAGILHNQRVLAEVTEMMKTSILIHNIIMNVNPTAELASDYYYGNKIALLSGDYLLSKSFRDLANLRNQTVNEIISTALRDLSEYEFLGCKTDDNLPIPSKPTRNDRTSDISKEDFLDFGPYNPKTILGNSVEEWILRASLRGANLLGKSCRATMILSKQNESLQTQAYLLGKHLGIALQAKRDSDEFVNHKGGNLNLVSAPVMLFISKNSDMYEAIIKSDFELVVDMVKNSSAIEDTKELKNVYIKRALSNLEAFEDSEAKDALKKIMISV